MSIPASFALDAYARAAGIGAGTPTSPAGGAKENGGGFGDILKQALDEAVETAKAGEQKIAATTSGREGNIVDVVTAVAEAEATLQTVVTVRDKVITAYQEIMRMPI